MPDKRAVLIAFVALLAAQLPGARGQAQDPGDDETVRGSFLTSRPAASSTNRDARTSSGSRRSARSTDSGRSTGRATGRSGAQGNSSTGSNGSGTGGTGAGFAGSNRTSGASTSGGSRDTVAGPGAAGLIGLGYTLYMRDNATGDALRVDPSREFHAGDRVRLALETNTDGYLYVFHTENNGDAEMIFPDARLRNGDNSVRAHVPYEVPSSSESSEALRWFVFDQKPSNERLYIVVTRKPLPLVPAGSALISYCRADASRCPWKPDAAVWQSVIQSVMAPVRTVKASTYGAAETAAERDATVRGLGLDQNAPPPSVIRMSASSSMGLLVTSLDLVHK